jgi:hypothetical protein
MKNSFIIKSLLVLSIGIIPEISAQYCHPIVTDPIVFQVNPRFTEVKADWYPGWIEYQDGDTLYPESLAPLQKWDPPFMKDNLPSAMHEDSYASDISNM